MKKFLCYLFVFLASLTANAADNLIQNVPADWDKEVFTFPLQFAPSIELEGIEEVYFAPGMFKPEASDYFNYIFYGT